MVTRTSTEAIVAAYRATGSVWAAGKQLGISGQTVSERLRAIDHPVQNRRWTAAETAELTELSSRGVSIGEIATRLGRPYGGIAHRLVKLGLTRGRGKQTKLKIPRGAGYDKATTLRHIADLKRYGGTLRQFCRANGLDINLFVATMQNHAPGEWDAYTRERSDLEPAACAYCEREFFPLNARQKCCTRKCTAHLRADKGYFGGKRRDTIGMAEGICQLCLGHKTNLHSHHVLGKENDPDNEVLIALCPGCHQIIGRLGARTFLDSTEAWERLIGLVLLRKGGGDPDYHGDHVYVDIERLTAEEAGEL